MIVESFGRRCDVRVLREISSISARGTTLKRLIEAAHDVGITCRPMRIELEYVPELNLPCILHWGLLHYVVLVDVRHNSCIVHDPAVGRQEISAKEFSRLFTGIAIECEPSAEWRELPTPKRLSWRAFINFVSGASRHLGLVFCLAAMLEVLQIVAPFYLQFTVDWIVGEHRTSLRDGLALAFLAVALLQGLFIAARSFAFIHLGTRIYLTWIRGLFEHILKLPLPFFERRYLGDLASRFEGISQIQRTLTTNFLASVLDGLMSIGFLTMMFVFNARLASVTVIAIGGAVLIRYRMVEAYRTALREYENSHAMQQSYLLETVRAVQSIKQFCAEGVRAARWSKLVERGYRRQMRAEKILVLFQASNSWLFGCERVFVIWYATGLVMHRQMSLGMLFGYILYREMLVNRASALLDRYLEARSAEIHLDRLGDIVFEEPEPARSERAPAIVQLPTERLEARDVWFRFSDDDPWILQGVSVAIDGRETLAITGTSGCGKSTLLKLLQGLLTPTRGSITFNGVPLADAPRTYRGVVAAVNQDDDLFIGTIAENISFFDAPLDIPRVQLVSRQASIASDIEQMPMQYNTLVTDTGLSFSGGQKQRLLLARALYKQAKVLFLDEATSQLDIETERCILDTIKQVSAMRIVVAHRPETVAACSRVLRLEKGVMR
jgi:ATP-binding cassette subfamily B protein RaxB